MAAAARVDLLGVELQRARVGKELLTQLASAVQLADLDQRRHEPEGADRERPLLTMQAVVGLFRSVAQHHAVDCQLVSDREHGRANAWILRREEADERDEQHRGVEGIGAVALDEDPTLVDAVLADVRLDLVRGALPRLRQLYVAVHLRETRAAIQRDPAHQLRRREVLRLAAHLPDAAIGQLPVLDRALDGALQDRPHDLGQVVARLGVQVHPAEHGSPNIVLLLPVRPVADADGPRALIPAEMVERLLHELMLAADAVHDLELLLARGRVGDEVEEVVGLTLETECVEAPEHERAVSDPRVAVVPVALAADRLRQRGRRSGEQSAGWAVGEALQRQGASLQIALPRVLRELAPVDPLPPEVGGALDALERFVGGRRRRVLGPMLGARRMPRPGPDHGHIGALALAEDLARVRARPLEPHAQVRDQPDRNLVLTAARQRLVVTRARVLPLRAGLSVVEDRLAVEAELDLADDAPRCAQEDVLRLVVVGGTAVCARAPLAVVPRADAHGVADDHPAGARPPRRLEHERPGQVAPARGDLDARGAEAEAPGRTVEDRPEHARTVRPRHAHPLHAPAGRDEAVDLAVGEKGVLGDGRERAGHAWLADLRPDLGHGRLAVAVAAGRDGAAEVRLAGFASPTS